MRLPLLAAVLLMVAWTQQVSSSSSRSKRQLLQNAALEVALHDKNYMRQQLNCVLHAGPCDKVGQDLRRLAPEILRGHCPRCSRSQYQQIRKVIAHVQRNYPYEWSLVLRKYFGPPPPPPPHYG